MDATYSETVDRAIPDGNGVPGVLDVPFTLAGSGAAENFTCSFWIEHTFCNDLIVELVTPTGDFIVLCNHDAGGFTGIGTGLGPSQRCTVTPDASIPWSRFDAPHAGTYLPHNPSDPIPAGTTLAGTWTFRIIDTASGDVGTLHGLSVTVSTDPSTATSPIWDPSSLGLTSIGSQSYSYRSNIIALSGSGATADAFVDADFSYDDTAFGRVPVGVLRTLTSCAVYQGSDPSGRYVQLKLEAIDMLGRDASGLDPVPPHRYGTVESFTAEMAGFGAVDLVVAEGNEFSGEIFSDIVPWDVADFNSGPTLYLMRPTALSWSGQWSRNAFNRTIWEISEVGIVTADFSVNSQSADLVMTYTANGYHA